MTHFNTNLYTLIGGGWEGVVGSDLLRDGRFRFRTPMVTDFPYLPRLNLRPTQPPVQWVRGGGLNSQGKVLTAHCRLAPKEKYGYTSFHGPL